MTDDETNEKKGKGDARGRRLLEDTLTLTPEIDEMCVLFAQEVPVEVIAQTLGTNATRVERLLSSPAAIQRIKYLQQDKLDRWENLSDRLYEEILESLIKDVKSNKLSEKARLEILKRLESRFGIFTEITSETQTISLPKRTQAKQITDLTPNKESIFDAEVFLSRKIEK